MMLSGDGRFQVTAGRWTSPPDQLTYIWRESGIDLMVPQEPAFKPDATGEYSCVVLARAGENWMLAIAETPWAKDGFVPRAWESGDLPWGKRYQLVK